MSGVTVAFGSVGTPVHLELDSKGLLPNVSWPGGYPLFYLDKEGNVLCADCASRDVDRSQEIVAIDSNWEDPALYCDDCSCRIELAYEEENEVEL
jgi:hypothetical protein